MLSGGPAAAAAATTTDAAAGVTQPLLGAGSSTPSSSATDSVAEAERERRAVMALVDSKGGASVASQAFDSFLIALGAVSLVFAGYTAITTWK